MLRVGRSACPTHPPNEAEAHVADDGDHDENQRLRDLQCRSEHDERQQGEGRERAVAQQPVGELIAERR